MNKMEEVTLNIAPRPACLRELDSWIKKWTGMKPNALIRGAIIDASVNDVVIVKAELVVTQPWSDRLGKEEERLDELSET